MKSNGVVESVILYYVIAFMALLFIPNPISSAVGVGIRPNKTVMSDKVTLINDKDGNPIAYRQVINNDDVQQKVGFWEWLKSLPIFVLFLMAMGLIFPPIALVLGRLWTVLKRETKKIVVSVDHALDNINDPVIKQGIKSKMSETQDTSTKKLVDKIQGKQ